MTDDIPARLRPRTPDLQTVLDEYHQARDAHEHYMSTGWTGPHQGWSGPADVQSVLTDRLDTARRMGATSDQLAGPQPDQAPTVDGPSAAPAPERNIDYDIEPW
ncbi:hypothetical protein ACFWBR_41405 [Streptomyces sp. NPDC060006]|uniref:hypothetical protein n=1 Tax=Streptomyces sp. NPDC060006 TaxID=3347035 RepID=UPI0036980CD5